MLLCFDIGGSQIKPGIAASMRDVRVLPPIATPLHNYAAFLEAILSQQQAAAQPVQALALSITGLHNAEDGKLKCANIPCADGRLLQRDLQAATGLPVMIFNDANCFALAEAVSGAGAGHDNVFVIILGSGVGGAQVLAGKVLAGAGGIAGEWGHGTIVATQFGQPPRPLPHLACGCGRKGCVNTIGGARGLEALHRVLCGETASSREILQAWHRGDAAAAETVSAYLELVAGPLAYAINITGASIVVAGGGLATDTKLVAELDQAVRQRILRQVPGPLLVPGQHAEGAGLAGAAIGGFQELSHG